MTRILDRAELAHSETEYEFQGHDHEAGVSFIAIDAPPGSGPKLHSHPYEEVFVVQEGSVTFTAGDDVIAASGGQVVVVPEYAAPLRARPVNANRHPGQPGRIRRNGGTRR